MAMAGPTTIPVLAGSTFAARLADLFPRGWASDDAKQTGNVYSLLLTIGEQLSFLQEELNYALLAQRIQTETAPELDLASVDFFANGLPRPAGMSDAAFAELIIQSLFRQTATRPALQQALFNLTGFEPRMLEPWSPADTGAWGSVSYWNVDTVANPARWGNGGLRYQGFIETAPPSIPDIGANNPILTWGTAYWNQPGYFFGIIQSAPQNALNDLVNNVRAFGTTVWLKLITPPVEAITAPGLVTSLTATSAGTDRVLLTWDTPTTGTPPFTFYTFYRQSGTADFLSGPVVTATSATVANLSPATSYDFQIIARNSAGASTSAIAVASPEKQAPSPAVGLQATQVQATAVTLSWSAPVTGTPPFTYSVNYRVTGTTTWQNIIVGQGSTTVTVINLMPLTSYDFEVVTTNL